MKLLQRGIKFNLGSGKMGKNNNLLSLCNIEKLSKNIYNNIITPHSNAIQFHNKKNLLSTPVYHFSTS
jgi:hypothetical protein